MTPRRIAGAKPAAADCHYEARSDQTMSFGSSPHRRVLPDRDCFAATLLLSPRSSQ